MRITAVFLMVLAVVNVTFAEECPNPTTCPCGSKGANVTVCAPDSVRAEVCGRLSNCEACEDGFDSCTECPEGLRGPTCSQVISKNRRKRQIAPRGSYGRNKAEQTAASSCSALDRPKLGGMRCIPRDKPRSCTGKCYPGYTFGNSESENEITLKCRRGIWTPRRSFPDCKSTGECDLVNLTAGESNCTSGIDGTKCTVRCNDRLVGLFSCYPGNAWTPALPACVVAKAAYNSGLFCNNPGSISNGKVEYFAPGMTDQTAGEDLDEEIEEFPEGSQLAYSCDAGFQLIGSRRVTCENTGFWSDKAALCVLDDGLYCDKPMSIPNGKVQYFAPGFQKTDSAGENLDPEQDEFPEGSIMEYSCDEGFRLQGSPTLICEASGFWSEEEPKCVTDSVSCKYPGDVANGRIVYIPSSGRRPSSERQEEYSEGSTLQYSCENGYIQEGPSTITCSSAGTWSGTPPKCLKLIGTDEVLTCEDPGRVLNGRTLYYAPGQKSGPGIRLAVDNEMEEFLAGSVLEYSCDLGFRLQGSANLSCQSTGFWSADRPRCDGDCGRSYFKTTVRIRQGQETVVGEWPWVVAVSVVEEDSSRFVCGGAVFNTRAIITAAHCLQTDKTYILRFGKHHFRTQNDDPNVLVRTSSRVIIHPDYSRRTYDSDIGLVMFEEPIEYSERVQPICLPTFETTVRNIRKGKVGYVSGWGDTERELPADTLLFAGLPILNSQECMESYSKQNLTLTVTGNMFCAGYANGTYSVCGGDSGSPFVFYDNLHQRYTLEGLVSFVVRRRTDAQMCGLPGRFAIFTKVFRFVPWLYLTVE